MDFFDKLKGSLPWAFAFIGGVWGFEPRVHNILKLHPILQNQSYSQSVLVTPHVPIPTITITAIIIPPPKINPLKVLCNVTKILIIVNRSERWAEVITPNFANRISVRTNITCIIIYPFSENVKHQLLIFFGRNEIWWTMWISAIS